MKTSGKRDGTRPLGAELAFLAGIYLAAFLLHKAGIVDRVFTWLSAL